MTELPKLEDLPIQLFRPVDHLLAFLKNGVRPDGRNLRHSRRFTMSHNVVEGKHIIGSAQCVLGGTMVIAALTLMVGMPNVHKPKQGDVGKLHCFSLIFSLISHLFYCSLYCQHESFTYRQ